MKRRAYRLRWRVSISVAVMLVLLLVGYSPSLEALYRLAPATVIDPVEELRGAWVQEKALRSRAAVNRLLRRAEMGGFNTLFVCVFADGRTLYESKLAAMSDRVEPGFNPLAYLVPEAHRRGINVHAWFVVGNVGAEAPILAAHPEWALRGPDGQIAGWLNFTRPDVRQYMNDLMLEVVERYNVDGIHFDYARYPGGEWGFDPYSIERFTHEYQYDLNQLRYADLPAYGTFEINPLSGPTTAEVLASFANGLPAVTLNRYGKGEVILLNWNASERTVAVGAEILGRGLQRLLEPGGTVHLLNSATNAEVYGDDDFVRVQAWLNQLGWAPHEVGEDDIASLDPASALVLPNVYRISSRVARQLASFVERGGGIIFIDGPTKSIGLAELRALIGMEGRARYFKGPALIIATGEHALIPTSGRGTDLEPYQAWAERWKTFRKRGISQLISEVHQRVKASDPDVTVSVTVTSDHQQAADSALQDWPAWLAGGYVDLLIPRAYVDEVWSLNSVLEDWRPVLQSQAPVTLGLKIFTADGKAAEAKRPGQLLREIQIALDAESSGIMLFDLDRVSNEQLRALARGPFFTPESQD